MIAPGNAVISSILGILLVITLCYAAGRLHQWHRATYERETAYRDGYDTATKSLFSLAARVGREITISRSAKQVFDPGIAPAKPPVVVPEPPVVRGAAPVIKAPAASRSSSKARHRRGDEGATMRLPTPRQYADKYPAA